MKNEKESYKSAMASSAVAAIVIYAIWNKRNKERGREKKKAILILTFESLEIVWNKAKAEVKKKKL